MAKTAKILNETDKKILRYVAYGLGSIALLGGLGYFIYNRITNVIATRQQNLSFEDGTEATYAKRLKMAFDNNGLWGTDVPAIRRVFQEIPTKDMFKKVQRAYTKLYRRNLIEDMTKELTNTEYNEMLNILAPKPDRILGKGEQPAYDPYAWAKRIHAAVNYRVMGFPATDEDAIRAVIQEIPTKQAWNSLKQSYEELYAIALENALDAELGIWDFDWKELIEKKADV